MRVEVHNVIHVHSLTLIVMNILYIGTKSFYHTHMRTFTL